MRIEFSEQKAKDKCNLLSLEYVGFYKKYKRGNMVRFICPIHRCKGVQETDWAHFRNSVIGCFYCARKHNTIEDIKKRMDCKTIKFSSGYIGFEKSISCECLVCGHVWSTIPKILVAKGAGCPECNKTKRSLNRRKSQEDFERDLLSVNPNIEVIGNYIGVHRHVKCRCRVDGCEWMGIPANLLNNSAGCPMCKMPSGERVLHNILYRHKISFAAQYKITIDGYKRSFRFDAYSKQHKIAWEFQGEQHYTPVDFSGKGSAWAVNEFIRIIKRDKAKFDYCMDNKITLIIIPYWEKSNMEFYIAKKLNEYGKGEIWGT